MIQSRVFPPLLDQKAPALFSIVLGVVIFKNHVAKPLGSFNKYRKIFFLAKKHFSAEIWNLTECHFWAYVETALCLGSQVAGFEGGLFVKFSRAKFFDSMSRYVFGLSAQETNLMKSTVSWKTKKVSINNYHTMRFLYNRSNNQFRIFTNFITNQNYVDMK